ncbi:MAG: ShlB/FhaC/HecB family hemolysin secretion/activation protein [Parvularculales bacterium]
MQGIIVKAQTHNTIDSVNQAEQLERDRAADENQRQIERYRKDQQPPDGDDFLPPERNITQFEDACLHINTILVTGVTLLPNTIVDNSVAEFEGQCIGVSALNNILEIITYLYIEQGYIASRALLTEQDLSDGILEIIVIEGRLDSIVMDDDSATHKNQINTAFPGLIGKPVNLRDVEQGLYQLNRLRSNDATIEIEAGQNQGSSVLKISRNKSKTWQVGIGFDNLGSTSTGKYQSKLDLELDDLFELNDQLRFSYQRSTTRNPYYFHDNPRSDTYTGHISVPYGYWTFSVNGSLSEYNSKIRGNFSDIETSGHSQSINTSISRVLHRDQTSITSLTGKLTRKNTENFILGSLIDVSSRALSISTVELIHSRQFWDGQLITSAAYHQGLNILDAYDDNDAPAGSPKGQFRSMTGSLSYFKYFIQNENIWTYNGQLNGQYAPDQLFGSEQVAYGGYSTIRGLRESVVFGNRGILMRNEIAFQLPQSRNQHYAKTFGTPELYTVLDHGNVFEQNRIGIEGGDLTGFGVGFRNRGGRIGFDVAWMEIVDSSTHLKESLSGSGLIYGRLSYFF